MLDIDIFIDMLREFAPTAPDPILARVIVQAAREFCQKTRSWTMNQTLHLPHSGRFRAAEPQSFIEAIEFAKVDGITLEPVTAHWLDANVPDWQKAKGNPARYITEVETNTLQIVPASAGVIELRLVLCPDIAARRLPKFLFNRHGDVIVRGAAGRLLTRPDKEYANPQLGSFYLEEFKSELVRLLTLQQQGVQRAPTRNRRGTF